MMWRPGELRCGYGRLWGCRRLAGACARHSQPAPATVRLWVEDQAGRRDLILSSRLEVLRLQAILAGGITSMQILAPAPALLTFEVDARADARTYSAGARAAHDGKDRAGPTSQEQ